MDRFRAALAGHGVNAAVLVIVLLMLIPAQAAVVLTVGKVGAPEPVIGAVRVADALQAPPAPKHEQTQAAETAKPKPERTAKAAKKRHRLDVFRGLGAWIDFYDYDLDPERALRRMKANGVRTLYIQTGRYNTPRAVMPQVGRWLVLAHRMDIEVVGWYLPSYKNVPREVKRTVAAARYRYRGHKLDGIGLDIEFKGQVRNPLRWNKRVARVGRMVRERLGDKYPIAGIVFPPIDMTVAPATWIGFPWKAVGAHSDVIMTMGYWSNRSCPVIKLHCSYRYTVENVRRVQRYVGRDIPVHVIGGIGDQINGKQVRAFVRAARDVDAFGASLYDYRTTHPAHWRLLRLLRNL